MFFTNHVYRGIFSQLLAVVTGTMTSLSDGMQYGWSAPLVPILKSDEGPVKITDSDAVWLENIYLIGGMCGVPIVVYFVDKLGRQKTMIGACIINMTGWIIIALANSVALLILARFLTGLAANVSFVSAPMYIAEIADKRIRGFLGSFVFLMMFVGIIIIYSIAPFIPMYASSAVGAAVVFFELLTFPFMPESPYYLLGKGKHKAAKKALMRFRGTADVDKELQEIAQAVERQQREKGRPQDLFMIKSNRKATTIMTMLNGAQQFASGTVMMMNLHIVLEDAGSEYLDSRAAAIIYSAVMFGAATAATLFFIDRYGRKVLLISSCITTAIAHLVIAVFFNFKNTGYDVSSVSWIPTVAVIVYAAVFRSGLGIVPIVMTGELFPAKVKALGVTFADLMYVVFGVISIEVFHKLYEHYGMHAPYYFFATSAIVGAIYCAICIPETKGKTLDEIQFMLRGEPYRPENVENGVKENENNENRVDIEMNGYVNKDEDDTRL